MADPKLQEWCKRARKLLKAAKAGDQNDAIKNLPEYLSKLESEDPAAYGRYREEFRRIVQWIGTHDTEKDRQGFQEASNQLAKLKDKVRANVLLEKCAKELSNLSPSTHPSVVALQDKLDAAHNLLNANNPEGAEFAVKGFSDLVKKAKSSIEATEKLEQENSKAFPNISKKRSDIEALLNKLRTFYGGHQALEAQLEKALEDTKLAASRGQWVEVATVLEDVPLPLPTDEDCRNTSQRLVNEAAVANPDIRLLTEGLNSLALALDISEWAGFAADNRKVLNPYLAAKGTERDKLAPAIKTQLAEQGKKVVEVAGMQTSLNKLLLDLNKVTAFLELNAPIASSEAQAMRTRIKQYEDVLSTKRLFAAKSLSKDLLKDAEEVKAAIEADMEAFDTACNAAPTLAELQKDAQTLSLTAESLPEGPLKSDIRTATSMVNPANFELQKRQTRDWQALASRVTRARLRLQEMQLREKAYQAFADERKQADGEVVPLLNEIDRAIVDLKKAYNTAGLDGEAAAKLLMVERNKAFKAWADCLASATDAGTLKLQMTLTLLGDLLARVKQSASTEGQQAHKARLAADAAEKAFHEEQKALDVTLESLAELDLDAPVPLLATAKRLLETAQSGKADEAAWKDALNGLRREHGQAKTVLDRLKIALTKQRQAVTTEFNNATTALGKLSEPLRKRFATLVSGLEKDMLELRTMGSGTNAQAAQLAIAELKTLTLRISQLAATPMTTAPVIKTVAELVKGGMKQDEAQTARDKQLLDVQSQATLGTVARDLDAFKLRLKDAETAFGKDHPAGIKQIQQTLKALEAQVQGMQPNLATAELQQLTASLDLAQSLVITLRTERLTAANVIKDVGIKVAELRKAGRYMEYVGSVAELLKGLIGEQKSAKEPAAVTSLLRRAEKLKQEVLEASNNPKVLQELQNALQAKELQQSKLEGEWIGHYPSNSAWEGKFLAQAKDAIAKNKGDEGQIKEIRNIVKRAVKLHKDGDVVAAIRQIKLAEARVREVVADPMGPALGSRKALTANARQFSADARELISLLTGLPERAAERVPTLEPKVKDAIKALADRAANRIAPEALTGFALQLDAQELKPTELRDLREKAMAQTRALRELLTQHPLIQQLKETPLNRAIPNVTRRLEQHVNRFEANVSRAVK